MGTDFWRTMYRISRKETEYWKLWSATFLFLLVVATMIILYLIYRRG